MTYPLIIFQGPWDSSSIPTLLENLSTCRKTLSHYEIVHQVNHSLVHAHEAWKTLYDQCTHLLVCSTQVTLPQNLSDYFRGIGTLIGLTSFESHDGLSTNLPIEDVVVCLPPPLKEKEPRSPIFHEGTFYHDLSAYLVSNEWEEIQSFCFSLRVTSQVYPVGYCKLEIEFEGFDDEIKEVKEPEVEDEVQEDGEPEEDQVEVEPKVNEQEVEEIKEKPKRKPQRRRTTPNPDTPLRRSSRLAVPSPSK